MQNAGLATAPQDRRRDLERRRDAEWRRSSQPGGVNLPSPALVRHGSKRRVPNALVPGAGNVPGTGTPLSAAAQINVPISTPQNRSNHVSSQQHPYANAATGDYAWDAGDEPYGSQAYGRTSPMVSTVGAAPPAISNVRAFGNEAGVSRGEDHRQHQDDDPPQPKSSIWRILTCRCG
jgi:casein kinase 1